MGDLFYEELEGAKECSAPGYTYIDSPEECVLASQLISKNSGNIGADHNIVYASYVEIKHNTCFRSDKQQIVNFNSPNMSYTPDRTHIMCKRNDYSYMNAQASCSSEEIQNKRIGPFQIEWCIYISVLRYNNDKESFPWNFCEEYKIRCCEVCDTLQTYLIFKPPLPPITPPDFPPLSPPLPPHLPPPIFSSPSRPPSPNHPCPPTTPNSPESPPNNPPLSETLLFTINSLPQAQVSSKTLNVSALRFDPYLKAEYVYTFENLILENGNELIFNMTACKFYTCYLSELNPVRIHMRVDLIQARFPTLDPQILNKFDITQEFVVIYSKYNYDENYVVSTVNNYLTSINANYSKLEKFSVSTDIIPPPSFVSSPPQTTVQVITIPNSPPEISNTSRTYNEDNNILGFVVMVSCIVTGLIVLACSYILYAPLL
jgi:hypothetical protein